MNESKNRLKKLAGLDKKVLKEEIQIVEAPEEQKRYVVMIDFYVYAKSDEEGIAIAKKMADDQRRKLDDGATVISIHSQPFGTMGNKLIYGKDLN